MGNEAFLFKFHDVATKNWVLTSGPWYIGQCPLLLRSYVKRMSFDRPKGLKFPISMKLWDIPLDIFSVEGISYIASFVGKPICLDKATAD